MSNLRRVVAAFAALVLLAHVAPAGAASSSIDDPEGDVDDPALDITGVSVLNEPGRVVVTIEVDEVVAFTDDRWDSGDIGVFVVLDDPASEDDFNLWGIAADEGEASGIPFCIEISQTASAYVMTGEGPCVRGLPRTLAFAAATFTFGDSEGDMAPDGDEPAGPVAASSAGVTTRLAGTDRILTAIELSQDIFSDVEAGAVVLAASSSFPDALAGGPLASFAAGPLLLTGAGGLDPRVGTELDRVLEPGGQVYVLGGTAALPDQVVTDVNAAGFDAERVAGVNRFETAVAIAEEVEDLGGHDVVLLADGRTFTDALIAGAAAPSQFAVVLLTDGATMPAATSAYLSTDGGERIAIGASAAAAAPGVRSITGANPSELSANVADELAPISGAVAVASQATFADALAGGPHIAMLRGPLLLTDPATLSTATRDAIDAADGSIREVVVYGGTAAISAGVVDAIDAALAP